MTDFIDAFTSITNGLGSSVSEANAYLTSLIEENPSVFLGNLINIISDNSFPLPLRINAIKQSTVFAHIKIADDGYAESVSMKEVDSSLIDNLIEFLQKSVLSPDEILPSDVDANQVTDFMMSAAKSLANYKIALYLLHGSDQNTQYPALEFLPFISTDNSQFVCDAAATVIQIIIDSLPLSKSSVVEQIISEMLTYICNTETSLSFKHIFINIAGTKINVFGPVVLEKNIELGVAFLQKLDELMEQLPEECFWFWLQVPTNCYPLLRLCADLPQIMFSAIESITQVYSMDESKKPTLDTILTNIMQFWKIACQVENGTNDLAKQNNLELVASNLEQILHLTLTIIQSDESTEAYTQGDYNSFIAALETLRVLTNFNYDTCFPALFEFISENLNSEDKAAKFAAAFCFRTLLDSSKSDSPHLQQLASSIGDVVTVLISDDSPRVLISTLNIISLGVIKGILEISQEIYEEIVQFTSSENESIQLEAIKCIGKLGSSIKEPSLLETVAGNLFEIGTQTENGTLSSVAFEMLRNCAINIEPETLAQMFFSVADFVAALTEQPDPPNLQAALFLVNRIFVILCKTIDLSVVATNFLQKFIELSLASLPTNAASAAISGLGIVSMFFGAQDPELIQKTVEIIVQVLTEKNNNENILSALEACLSVIHSSDDESILQVIAEKNMEILADVSLDPNEQCLTLDVFGAIAPKAPAIIGQLIESAPLIPSMLRLLNHGSKLSDIKYLYNFIVALTHFIEPGTEIDPSLVHMIKKSIKMIGMMSSIPDSLADVSIDLLFSLFQRNEEEWARVCRTSAARNIIKSTNKCTDPTTVERRNALIPLIPT